MNSILQNVDIIKDKDRLWECSRLKKAKETRQLNPVSASMLIIAGGGTNAVKDIIGSVDKTGVRMGRLVRSMTQMLNLVKLI